MRMDKRCWHPAKRFRSAVAHNSGNLSTNWLWRSPTCSPAPLRQFRFVPFLFITDDLFMSDNVAPNPPSATNATPNYAPLPLPLRARPNNARPSPQRPLCPEADDLLQGYRPTRAWEYQPMTPGQQRYLASLDVPYTNGLTKGEASHLIDTILDGEPTWRQIAKLKYRGQWREGMTRREASVLCGQPGIHPLDF
jgi:hypothetical protein